jgi:hypothetical protein
MVNGISVVRPRIHSFLAMGLRFNLRIQKDLTADLT